MVKGPVRRRSIGDAKAHFAECIREAEAGSSIVLTRHGRPVARLEPILEPRHREGEGRELLDSMQSPRARKGMADAFAAAPARLGAAAVAAAKKRS